MKKGNLSNKNSKGKKIFDIISWVVVSVLFLTSLTLLIVRKSTGSLTLFGNRYDVVLSNSMSYKNEEHKDFLKGHNDQIQKMDVVRSKTVDKTTKLDVYDIVLYKDSRLGTNMHRIVDKKVHLQDELYLQQVDINDNKDIVLKVHDSAVYSNNTFSFKHGEITFVSESETFSDGYYFSSSGDVLDYTVNTTKKGSSYYHKVIIDKTSDRPGKFAIVHNKAFIYGSEVIQKIYFKTANGKINTNGKNFSLVEDDNYQFITNVTYEYEIRGDAAKTSDGWFTIDKIYSKVNKIIPKAGYITRFVTSIPGIIMLVGLGLIVIGLDFGLEWIDKKEKEKNKLVIYYLTNDESCSYDLKGQNDNSESLNAEKVGTDRYNTNIYKISVDSTKYQTIKFSDHDDISLDNIESGTGFYYENGELRSYMHEIDTKGKKDENKKK